MAILSLFVAASLVVPCAAVDIPKEIHSLADNVEDLIRLDSSLLTIAVSTPLAADCNKAPGPVTHPAP